jgi:phospholipid/cholesterol/gamma-HCH transport system substrate-binding protein
MKRASSITWEQLRVGAVIVGALTVVTIAIYKLGHAANLFSTRYELIAFLREGNGLREGGTVLVAGQFAGTIKQIEFLPVDEDTLRNLRVRLAVDERLEAQIRRDSKARVRTLGLLGDKVIDIIPGTPRYAPLRPGDTLVVAPALDYESVLAEAAGAVDDMVALTHQLNEVTSGILRGKGTIGQLFVNPAMYDRLLATIARADRLLSRVQNANGTVARLLDDPTLYDQFVGVLSSADSLIVSLNDTTGTIGRLLHDDSVYAHLSRMAATGDTLMRALATGQGLAGKLLNDPALYERLNKLTTDLDALLGDVRRDPRRYLRGLVCVLNCKK